MNKNHGLFILIILVILLSGCSQWAVTPRLGASRITPDIEGLDIAKQGVLEASLDPVTARTLEIFPLRVGTTWVYEYLGFDSKMNVVWRVTERVVDALVVNGYYLAKITREAQCIEGNPPDKFLNTPETGTFWYLVEGSYLYFFEDSNSFDLDDAYLDLIIPFSESDQGWYPQPDLRGNTEPGQIGYRQASAPYQEVIATGKTVTCYNVSTIVEDGKEERTFCETIGFLFKEKMSFEQVFGYEVELVGFAIQ